MKVVFSHGKESGPWGTKISHLAEIAKSLGFEVDSIDYQESMDPEWRVQRLLEAVGEQPVILVGSSMGGYVSTVATTTLQAEALFLMAPAFYLPGYAVQRPDKPPCPVTIVHGWGDTVVPVDNVIRFAQAYSCALHVIDSDHGLNDSLDVVGGLFADFLHALR